MEVLGEALEEAKGHSHRTEIIPNAATSVGAYWYWPPGGGYVEPTLHYPVCYKFPEVKLTFFNEEEPKKESVPMKSLYNVIVVTKKEDIILDVKVVAEDTREAEFLAGVADVLKEKGLKPRDVTVICFALGSVKVEKEPEKVKIVKE